MLTKNPFKKKYKGGIEQFRSDFHNYNQYFQEDNELFSLTKMNSDEFSIEQLTRKGLEYDDKTQTSDDFVIVDRYGGAYWRVDWLEAGSVYAYHKNASLSNIAEVMQMEQITIDEIVRIFESGGKPFKTIK